MESPCRSCPRDAWCVHFCPQFRAWFRPAWDEARERIRRGRETDKKRTRAARQMAYRAEMREVYREEGERLQAYRRALGLKQREVAELAGVSVALVSQWETGTAPYDVERIREIPGFEGFI